MEILPSLVGVGGAGGAGRAWARGYVKTFARGQPPGRSCALLTSDTTGFAQPGVSVIIWRANEPRSRAEFDVWADRLDQDASAVVLGVYVGDGPPRAWPRRVVRLTDAGPGGRTLTAALDCVVAMLLAPNWINLRVHELREVLEKGTRYVFATAQTPGEESVQGALSAALADPVLAAQQGAVRGVWMHVAGPAPSPPKRYVRAHPDTPVAWKMEQASERVALHFGAAVPVWAGGTESHSLETGVRVSVLAALI